MILANSVISTALVSYVASVGKDKVLYLAVPSARRRCGNEHLFLLVLFAIAGVSLVVLLLLLNLTVAAGTIHELIFYANIIASHLSPTRPEQTLAWLNLDLGIETCFYNWMDNFFKTCLQFVFPLYVWTLVGALVYISCHSLLVSKLLGTNTIPVLATLYFLSYAKILHIILVALSLTSLSIIPMEKKLSGSMMQAFHHHGTFHLQ